MDRYMTIYGIILRFEYLSEEDLALVFAIVRALRLRNEETKRGRKTKKGDNYAES